MADQNYRSSEGNDSPSLTVYVGGIPYDTDEQTLKNTFSGCVNAIIVTEKDTGKSRGFALLEFEDEVAKENAIKQNTMEFCGRTLKITAHTPPKLVGDGGQDRQRGGGCGGGGRGQGRGYGRGYGGSSSRGRGDTSYGGDKSHYGESHGYGGGGYAGSGYGGSYGRGGYGGNYGGGGYGGNYGGGDY